jgi:hypothetical protein
MSMERDAAKQQTCRRTDGSRISQYNAKKTTRKAVNQYEKKIIRPANRSEEYGQGYFV